MQKCPFCSIDKLEKLVENDFAFAIKDAFPVSKGHMLIISKRHIASIFEATKEEVVGLWDILQKARARLINDLSPDGFNIGINDGTASGQTVLHLHIHLIPRYKGDKLDPRGGIRWIFPNKAVYWKD